MTHSLAGRTALVTGAGGGIGRATAALLAARGARVAVHAFRHAADAEALARTIDPTGRNAVAVTADVRSAAEVARLHDEVTARLGPVDILVNNAGDLIQRQPLDAMTEALWREVIDLNLTSVFLVSKAFVPDMRARGGGAIVNMSSLAAHNGGGPGAMAYAAAKGGVLTMTRAMARELAPYGIRVNAVAPGLIGGTAFHATHTASDAFAAAAKTVPLGRAGTPEEVAHVMVFLAGDESAYLTGETIEINGGLLMT